MAKKIKKAILAGLTAYAASKMLGKGKVGHGIAEDPKLYKKAALVDDYNFPRKPPTAAGIGTRGRNPTWYERIFHGGRTQKKEGGAISATVWKKHGGAIRTEHAKLGKMIKAAQGSHVKSGTMLKARHGTEVRTMGSNPHVPSGGTAYVKTKLNGTLKVKTF